MSGDTLDDPLSDRFDKLGCSISALEKDSEDYKMITNYLEKTYEPVKLGDIVRLKQTPLLPYELSCNYNMEWLQIYIFASVFQEYGVSVENIFAIESSASPPMDELKKLPNKVLLWCGKFHVLVILRCWQGKAYVYNIPLFVILWCRN